MGIEEGSSDRWPLEMGLEERVEYGQSEMGGQQRTQRQDLRQKQEEGPFEEGDALCKGESSETLVSNVLLRARG